ncbi:MAG TPA: CHRD domain-containing protein [Flavisolibacter sp.]
MRKISKLLSIATALVIFLSACEKEKEVLVTNPVYNLRGNANGFQEAPTRVTTAATGTLTGNYNKDNNILTYTITWTGLTGGNPTAMHFHGAADPGVAAGVQVGITGFPTTASGTVSGTTPALTDAQEADLLNGLWYYNIHNATYPGGEIRGQVFLTQ